MSSACLLLVAALHGSVLMRPPLASRLEPVMLRLRGGSEGVEEAASAKTTAPKTDQPAPTLVDEPPPPSCWSAVRKLLDICLSLLTPKHGHAKAEVAAMKEERPEESIGYAPDDESWRTQRKKLNHVELPPAARKRVLRDLRRLKAHDDERLVLEESECLTDWVVKLVGAPGTVFDGEIYRLRIRLHPDYPTRPPTVVFMRPAPMYEHVYSNGMVCLDLLGAAWDPRLDVLAICLSIQSMLASAKNKSRPPDNEVTSVMARGQDARDMAWHPHDDDC